MGTPCLLTLYRQVIGGHVILDALSCYKKLCAGHTLAVESATWLTRSCNGGALYVTTVQDITLLVSLGWDLLLGLLQETCRLCLKFAIGLLLVAFSTAIIALEVALQRDDLLRRQCVSHMLQGHSYLTVLVETAGGKGPPPSMCCQACW